MISVLVFMMFAQDMEIEHSREELLYESVVSLLEDESVSASEDPRYENLRGLVSAIHNACEQQDDYSDCVSDAVGTCWVESRCQLNPRGRVEAGGACGAFQQVRRYGNVSLIGGDEEAPSRSDFNELCYTIRENPEIAVQQFLIKRNRYIRSHGSRWTRRYRGVPDTGYVENHRRIKTIIESIMSEYNSEVG